MNGNGNGSPGGLRVLALAATMAATATCTDANESLIILQAQRPDEQCLINDGLQGSIRHDRGTLDVALDKPYGYQLFPLVSNNLLPIAAENEIEPNRVSRHRRADQARAPARRERVRSATPARPSSTPSAALSSAPATPGPWASRCCAAATPP